MDKPNIVFIFTDDQRFDTLSALGNTEIDTPNLDRLVSKGTIFTHSHIMGGTAGAVCMPSRAMMLTGRTLFSLERQGQRIPPAHTAMPELFRANGYVTAHVGKWHQDRESHRRCFSTGAKIFGFKRKQGWYEACNGHWHIPVHDFDASADYDPNGGYNAPTIEPFSAPFETVKENGKHSAEVFTDAALEFIHQHTSSQNAAKPFFLYLAHIAPHDPRQYPKRLSDRYTADRVTLPSNFATRHPFDNGELLIRDELLECFPRRRESVRQHLADYYAIIAHVDEQIGRILDTLEETRQAQNTIVIFAADNGLAVGQHGLMGKQNLYDHSIRVPLIFSGPGIAENQRADTLCYLHDIFPTLCDLTDLKSPETVQGKSLLPAIQEPIIQIRDTLHFAYKEFQRGVRKGNHKLIEYAVNGNRTQQLFDLENDPLEMNNLVGDSTHSQTLASLKDELKKWQSDLGDTQEMGRQFWGSA